jgi:DNA-binding MarR family transcriptional regulator
MIKREEDPSDRRRLISVLTLKGISVLNDFNKCTVKLSSELFSGMDEKESANLANSISVINTALSRMLETKQNIKKTNNK